MKNRKKLLRRFKDNLFQLLPGEIELVQLFGSEARGESTKDSDIDILVVTKSADWHLSDQIGEIAYNLLLETGVYISTKVMSLKHYNDLRRLNAPFILNVLKDGVPL